MYLPVHLFVWRRVDGADDSSDSVATNIEAQVRKRTKQSNSEGSERSQQYWCRIIDVEWPSALN